MARSDVVTVTPVCDTGILAVGDIIFDFARIRNAVRIPGGRNLLISIGVLDFDDQGTAIDLVFATGSTSLGTLNNAPTMSDANALAGIVGYHPIAAADFLDLGGFRYAHVGNIWKMMEAADAQLDMFVAGICRSGTPTYTASGLSIRLGFEEY